MRLKLGNSEVKTRVLSGGALRSAARGPLPAAANALSGRRRWRPFCRFGGGGAPRGVERVPPVPAAAERRGAGRGRPRGFAGARGGCWGGGGAGHPPPRCPAVLTPPPLSLSPAACAAAEPPLRWEPRCRQQLRHLQDGAGIAARQPPRLEGRWVSTG